MLGRIGGRGHLRKSIGIVCQRWKLNAQAGARQACKLLSVKIVLRSNSLVRMLEQNRAPSTHVRNLRNFTIPRKELAHIPLSEWALKLWILRAHVERR